MKGHISKKHNLGYRFIPKVASSSIKSKLLELEKINITDLKDAHKTISNNQKIDACERRFIFIRDPIKRFLSAYSNRVGYHQELSKEFVKQRLPKLHYFMPHFNPNLNQFIRYYKLYRKVPTIRHHTKPISSFLGGHDLSFFSDVYKIEELAKFEHELSGIYSQEVRLPRKQTGGKKLTLKSLDKRQIKYLLKLYDQDYKLLKDHYTKEMVWDEWKSLTNN